MKIKIIVPEQLNVKNILSYLTRYFILFQMLYAKEINKREETFDKIITMSEQFDKQLHMLILKNETIKFMRKKDVEKK